MNMLLHLTKEESDAIKEKAKLSEKTPEKFVKEKALS
jgi:hypothetical protein